MGLTCVLPLSIIALFNDYVCTYVCTYSNTNVYHLVVVTSDAPPTFVSVTIH